MYMTTAAAAGRVVRKRQRRREQHKRDAWSRQYGQVLLNRTSERGTGPDLRGGRGPGPQASHQQRASHQTRHILFVVHNNNNNT